MASLSLAIPAVTGLFTGIVGSSAANSAAAQQQRAAQQAAANITQSTSSGQQIIGGAAQTARNGVSDATQAGVGGINSATQQGIGNIQSGASGAQSSLYGALGQQLGNLKPYQDAGSTGLAQLQQFLGAQKGFSFDPSQIANTPEYQFQLQQGNQAVQQSAAASGSLLSGGTLKALDQYSQGLASTAYQQAYNNSLNTYNTNYQNKLGGLLQMTGLGTGATSAANSDIGNYGNSLAQLLSGTGNQLAQYGLGGAQSAGQLGLSGANSAGQFGLGGATSSANLGLQGTQSAQNAAIGGANAGAAGTIGAANAWSSGFGQVANAAQYAMNPYGGQNPYAGYGPPAPYGTSYDNPTGTQYFPPGPYGNSNQNIGQMVPGTAFGQ